MAEELGVEVTQTFEDATPNLSDPSLNTILIGEHYQITTDANLGSYPSGSGVDIILSYPDLLLGAVITTDTVGETEVSIVDDRIGVVSLLDTEFTATTTQVSVLTTTSPGSGVPGVMERKVEVVQSESGQAFSVPLSSTANFRDTTVDFIRLGVAAGDYLFFTSASTNGNPALGDPVVGSLITAVIDSNSLVLADAPVDATGETYVINQIRQLGGPLLVSYRAQRSDLVGVVKKVERRQDIENFAGPADTRNPLGLAAAIFENSAPNTAFYLTALSGDQATDHITALDRLEEENVYNLVPLQMNTDELDLFSTYEQHVDNQSLPENKKFRVAFLSRTVPVLFSRVESKVATGAGPYLEDGAGANEITLNDDTGDFLAAGVEPGDIVKVSSSTPADWEQEYIVKAAISATELTLVGDYNTITGVAPPGEDATALTYSIDSQDLTSAEQAEFLKTYAEGIENRRIVNLVAGRGKIKTIFTGDEWVDAFYANAAIAGLSSSLPPQQGFSRLPVPGISDIQDNSSGRFLRSDLNLIGEGGNMILIKPTEADPVSIRRQNTTDKTTAKKAELSIIRVVDFVSFAYIGALEPFIGKFNVVPSFFSSAQTVLDSVRHNLTSNELPGVGPVLLAADIVTFAAAPNELGVIDLVIDIDVPFPVNRIKVNLLV
jgi:hypothetical protein